MIIHSSFKDYYDNASAYGVDSTLHFDREKRRVKDPKTPIGIDWVSGPRQFTDKTGLSHGNYFVKKIIGFCGWIYPMVHTNGKSDEQEDFRTELCFYNYEKYKEFKQPFERKERIGSRRYRRYGRASETKDILTNAPYKNDEIFIEMGVPIFLALPDYSGEMEITHHVRLKDYQFYKVKDPATAFQEIAMYLSNELVREKEVLEIADRYRIAQHGFDKHSFRHPIK